ncbi:MAG: HEPN domain-containing protein [Pyrobaculum sp.]|uniref:HEPN domain-containing protein n=1 Tax=Pyrobaculum sp. TaxID=2004705 RepID=UPI003C918587
MSWERWADWLSDAEDDLAAALDLVRLGRYAKACFLAQQAAEKALKALLIAKSGRYARSHSVLALVLEAERLGLAPPPELREAAEELDRHYVPSRYPNAWPWGPPHAHYRAADAEKCIKNAEAVLEYVRRAVGGG